MSPDVIDRYEIETKIGRSPISVVLRAYDPQQARHVAIKTLSFITLPDPTIRAEYERKVLLISEVKQPAIVPVYQVFEQAGQLNIVMQHMSGGTLADKLKKGPLTEPEAIYYLERLASALGSIHNLGFLHGDIKPSNVLFDDIGEPYLSDYCMPELIKAFFPKREWMIFGPPGYLSPELLRRESSIQGSSDIYMLGVLFFEVLTGKLPYQANSILALAVQHSIFPVPDLKSLRPDLPPGFRIAIRTAMAKDPANRFSSAQEMASSLESTDKTLLRGKEGKDLVIPEVLYRKPSDSAILQTQIGVRRQKEGASALEKKLVVKKRQRTGWVWVWGSLIGIFLMAGYGIYLLGESGIGPLSQLATSTSSMTVSLHPSSTTWITLEVIPTRANSPTPSEENVPMVIDTPTLVFTATPVFTPTPRPSPTPLPNPTESQMVLIATQSDALNYTVLFTDTLFTIASRFHLVISDLLGVNNLTCNKPPYPGKEISIPPSGEEFAPIPGVGINVNTVNQLNPTYTLECINNVRAVAFSPDQTSLAAASGNLVYLWEVGTWKFRVFLKGHYGNVTTLAFTPDGKMIATGSDDTTVRLWDVNSGTLVKTLKKHTNQVTGVVFSPDNKILLSTSRDQTVRFWNLDGSEKKPLSGYPAFSAAFSPDSSFLAVGYVDRATIYRLDDLSIVQTFETAEVVRSLAFSPDGSLLASNSALWHVQEGISIYQFHDLGNKVSFSSDGQLLAIGRRFYRLSNGEKIHGLLIPLTESPKKQSDWDSGAFSPNGDFFTLGTIDGLFVWKIPDNTVDTSPTSPVYECQHGDTIYNLAFNTRTKLSSLLSVNKLSCENILFPGQHLVIPATDSDKLGTFLPDLMPINAENAPNITSIGRLDMKCVKDMGKIFIASDGQSLVSGSGLWNIPTGALLIQATNLPHNFDGSIQTQIPSQLLVLSPDGKTLAIRSGNQVELWDVITGKLLRNLTGHNGLVTSLAFSADSKLLASGSGSDEQMIFIWKVDDGSLAGSLPGYTALNLAYTPDGDNLIIEGGNAVRIWRFSENRVLDPLQGIEGNVVLSPDGMFLAYASCSKRVSGTCLSKLVSLYRLSEGTVAYPLTPMTGEVQSIQFSNDGSMVAAASRNGINIWRVIDGTTVQNMHILNSVINVQELTFSPDGKLIVSSSEDNILRVWQIADGKMLYENSIQNISSIAFSPDGTFIAVLADMLELLGIPR